VDLIWKCKRGSVTYLKDQILSDAYKYSILLYNIVIFDVDGLCFSFLSQYYDVVIILFRSIEKLLSE